MPISDCEVRDPRIRRTRRLLQGALRTLLHAKNFDALSVQDIADAATVNRATFYDHYTDKFALLEAMVAGEFHRLLEERKVRFNASSPSAAASIVLATCDFLAGCSAEPGPNHDRNAFEPLADAAVVNAIRRVLVAGMSPRNRSPDIPAAMIAGAASWAIYGAVKEWLHLRRRPSAEAIVPTVLELVGPILSPVCPQSARKGGNGGLTPAKSRRRALNKTIAGAG
jgi:AcrR family transcriptional regulator